MLVILSNPYRRAEKAHGNEARPRPPISNTPVRLPLPETGGRKASNLIRPGRLGSIGAFGPSQPGGPANRGTASRDCADRAEARALGLRKPAGDDWTDRLPHPDLGALVSLAADWPGGMVRGEEDSWPRGRSMACEDEALSNAFHDATA